MTDENPNWRNGNKNCYTGLPKCPECGARSRPDNGKLICPFCKVVVQENYWNTRCARRARTNADSEPKARSMTTDTRHDRGLGSSGSTTGQDLVRTQPWWENNHQSLQIGNNQIKRMTADLNLPNRVSEEASRLFRATARAEEKPLEGRSIELATTGSVYAAAYLHGVPRTHSEVADQTCCDDDDVRKGHKLVLGRTTVTQFLPNAVDYLPRFARALHDTTGLNRQQTNDLRSTAHHLISHTENQNVGARVLAASALYAAAQARNISITQSDVTEVTGVNEATISRRYEALLNTAS